MKKLRFRAAALVVALLTISCTFQATPYGFHAQARYGRPPTPHYSQPVTRTAPRVPDRPPEPVETQEQKEKRIAITLALAVGTKIGLQPKADDDFFDAAVKQLGSSTADAVIGSCIDELLIDECSAIERKQLTYALCALSDGGEFVRAFAERNARGATIEWLDSINPDYGNNARLVDFFVSVGQRLEK